MTDSTFKVLFPTSIRSKRYESYRTEWNRRGDALDPSLAPVHLDIELSAICDLKCPFCQIHTHKHIRTEGFEKSTWKPGLMEPELVFHLLNDAEELGVQSIKFNYRGEATLHPMIIPFICSAEGRFPDIMLNTNGNGGARKYPDIFTRIVGAGITNLMFSVDACTEESYKKQRIGGDWELLLNSVKSAIEAKKYVTNSDCRIRASAVRTKLNKDDIDSGRMKEFWIDKMGVDWMTISECYKPAGVQHSWATGEWLPASTEDFQCADPFRRMIVTWDGKHTLPCCQSISLALDGGAVIGDKNGSILRAWHSKNFNKLRNAHIARTWDKITICRACPLTHRLS